MIDESKLSIHDRALLYAVCLGYKIDVEGNVTSHLGKKLKPQLKECSGVKYYKFSVRFENKTRYVKYHRFQAYNKFTDEIFTEGLQVRHLDGNSLNNSADNIILGTHQDNQDDISAEKRKARAIYVSSFNRKFTDAETELIFQDRFVNNFTYKKLCKKYNTSNSTLHFILNKSEFSKSWRLT